MPIIRFYMHNDDSTPLPNGFEIGHAFIEITEGDLPETTAGQIPSGFYGFYPLNSNEFNHAPGHVVDDFEAGTNPSSGTHFIIKEYEISESQLEAVKALIAGKTASPGEYSLTSGPNYVCVDFVQNEIAAFDDFASSDGTIQAGDLRRAA